MSAPRHLLSLCLLTVVAVARTPDDKAHAHQSFLQALKEASSIAHERKLNIDERPDFTTVLHGEELRGLGVRTLFDALALVPGIQTSVMQNGIKKVVMRGYDNPNNFVYDKFKLFIDGHPVQNAALKNSSFYLDFPVELIDRIEVVLGPGAALLTSGALTGVVLVTTRNAAASEGAMFAGGGSDDEVMGGMHTLLHPTLQSTLAFDGYYRTHDRMVDAPMFVDHAPITREPDASEWLRDFTAGLRYTQSAFTLSGRIEHNHHGNYFGWEETLEPNTDRGITGDYLYLQAHYDHPVTSEETLKMACDYSYFKFDADATNFIQTGNVLLPVDLSMLQSESIWQTDLSILSHRFAKHTLTLGWHAMADRQRHNTLKLRYPDGSDLTTNLVKEGLSRYVTAFYITDTAAFTDRLEGRFALRYDRYSDLHKNYVSADAAFLYRFTPKLHGKIGYGHAYRTPSWVELYTVPLDGLRTGNPDLDAEEADTVEASLLYRPSPEHRLRFNIYYINVDHWIDNDEHHTNGASQAPEYGNFPNRESKGFELSYRFHDLTHTVTAACAYNDTEYVTETGHVQSMPGVAHWNGHITYIHELNDATTLSARIQAIGPKTAHKDFDTADIPSSVTLDIAYHYLASDGWQCFAGIKNLFDADLYDRSYYGRHEGLPRPGRRLFFSVEFPL